MVHQTPDLEAPAVTIGHAKQLLTEDGAPEDWYALTDALIAEHTPDQPANC